MSKLTLETNNVFSFEAPEVKGIEFNEISNKEFNENIKNIVNFVDAVFNINEETFDEVEKMINGTKYTKEFIKNLIRTACTIRPKNFILYRKIIDNQESSKEYMITLRIIKNIEEFYTSEKTVKLFMDDDVETFMKLIDNKEIDPRTKLTIKDNDGIKHVSNTKFGEVLKVTYMQLMAYFGAIKCFKFALQSEEFDLNNIARYAFAGGCKEIIDILEENHTDFSNCLSVAIEFNRYELCYMLIKKYGLGDIESDRTLFMLNIPTVFFILKNNLDNSMESAEYLLCEAVRIDCFELVKYFHEELHVNAPAFSRYGRSPLYFAAENHNLEMTKYLINECKATIIKESEEYEDFPMYFCADEGDLPLFKYYVSEWHLNPKQKFGKQTTLHIAAMKGNVDLIRYLINDCKLGVEVKDEEYATPLHCAVYFGNYEAAKVLIEEFHANVNTANGEKESLLHVAVFEKNAELISLIGGKHHARLDTRDLEGQTPFEMALNTGNYDLIKAFIKDCNVKPNTYVDGKNPFHYACWDGNIQLLQFLVEECFVNVAEKTKEVICQGRAVCRRSGLHIAAEQNKPEVIKYLINVCHCNVNERMEEGLKGMGMIPGQTPLNIACICKSHEAAVCLVNDGNANITDDDIKTAKGKSKEFLLRKTLLHRACKVGSIPSIQKIIDEKSIDVDQKYNGKTPLHVAIEADNLSVIKYLIEECHAKINIKDGKGRDITRIAKETRNKELIDYLSKVK